ncbi:MAG: hypothetical protein CVU44_01110 [Chloroflexi bacterium HGW-Chloroflexi-6]|nr:MAG: hypothetical protein CVU44_01110 [Chloroflexi bacterium HGW-Chloroflexi-6]
MNETSLYCANHPTVETALRCKKCEKLICVKCAVRTPTGYQCKECIRGQQKIFETSKPYDYITGFITAAVLSGIGSFVFSLIGFIGYFGFFIAFAAAPTIGVIIAEAVRMVTGRRRSPTLYKVILAGIIIGAIPMVLFSLLDIFGLIFQGIYLFLAVPTAYYRISGIRITK